MGTRDTILTADDLGSRIVDVPEWDVQIELRGMTGKQRMKLWEATQAKSREHFYADLLIACTYDPDTDELLFEPADRDAIGSKSGAVLDRLTGIINELSGTSIDDAEEKIEADPT